MRPALGRMCGVTDLGRGPRHECGRGTGASGAWLRGGLVLVFAGCTGAVWGWLRFVFGRERRTRYRLSRERSWLIQALLPAMIDQGLNE